MATALGVDVEYDTLRAKEGGMDAMMIPRSEQQQAKGRARFVIIVDPYYPQNVPFLICHEIAHILEGSGRSTPPIFSTEREELEKWCDEFARTLLEAL